MKDSFLFFLRAYNDIDHLAPLIHFLLEFNDNCNAKLAMVDMNYDLFSNENVVYLKSKFKDRIELSDIKKFSIQLRSSDKDYLSKKDVVNWLEKLVPSDCRCFAIFDHNRHKHNEVIVNYMNQQKITTFTLPHAIDIFTNIMMTKDNYVKNHQKESDVMKSIYYKYDKIVFPDHLNVDKVCKILRNNGEITKEFLDKTEVLGSLRFCPEWMEIRENLVPEYQYETKKLKVVIFMTNPFYNGNQGEIVRMLEMVSKYNEISLIIKEHTRATKMDLSKYKNSSMVLGREVPSSSLVKWADVVIGWGTGMVIEAMLFNKVVLNLRYLHCNSTVFEDYDANWIIRNRDELMEALDTLIKNPTYKPYEEKNVSSLFKDLIYGGEQSSVPKRYINLFYAD